MPRVFLSHSCADKPFARKLALRLVKAGVDVWIDEAELAVGDSLLQKLAEGIKYSDFVVAIISSASIGSAWVDKELQLAMAHELHYGVKSVLPILIDNVRLPDFLADKLYVDFRISSEFDSSFTKLFVAINGQKPDSLFDYLSMISSRMNFARMRSVIGDHPMNQRVLIFWGLDGVDNAARFAAELSAHGIPATALEHRDIRPADAVFVARSAASQTLFRCFQGLASPPKYIFPFDYSDLESGAASEFVVSLGLHSDTHEPTDDVSLKPTRLPLKVFRELSSGALSNKQCIALISALFSRCEASRGE